MRKQRKLYPAEEQVVILRRHFLGEGSGFGF